MKTVEQAIHDVLWKALSEDLDVYDSRPMTEVKYPFADFEDFNSDFSGTKSGPLTQVTAVINIWDTENNRKNVSDLAHKLMQTAIETHEAYGHKVTARMDESSIKLMQDATVTPSIWRGMVTIIFSI
jgi:23S rRNA A2030 N6-methylase RlmJ